MKIYIKSSASSESEQTFERRYETKSEFLGESDRNIRKRIRSVLDKWLIGTDGREVLHDSDIEDLKYMLNGIGIDISWGALYDFLGVDLTDS